MRETFLNKDNKSVRNRVAHEAANMIYTSQALEYYQAKLLASESLRTKILPTNREIAEQLDNIAEVCEGSSRNIRLIGMRKTALRIMNILERYKPKLVGSVWRGTTNYRSDIDIHVYSFNPDLIVLKLKNHGFKIESAKYISVCKSGKTRISFHVIVNIDVNCKAEIVVRSPSEVSHKQRCEIYGDYVKGLTISMLSYILENDPLRRFIPIN